MGLTSRRQGLGRTLFEDFAEIADGKEERMRLTASKWPSDDSLKIACIVKCWARRYPDLLPLERRAMRRCLPIGHTRVDEL